MTRLCRDRCHYCTFAVTPGQLRREGEAPYLSVDEVLRDVPAGRRAGCKEALFTLGDRPEDRWPAAREWLDEAGYDSTLDYVRALAVRVLEETGLLPHLNPGVMTWEELARLKPVAPVDGDDAGDDRDPAVHRARRRALRLAGQGPGGAAAGARRTPAGSTSRSPPGILVGIGETLAERAESMFAIRRVARAYGARAGGHRPELPGQAGHGDALGAGRRRRGVPGRGRDRPGRARAADAGPGPAEPVRRRTSSPRCSAAGVDDWGGVSPLTPDHVNPERPWPALDVLRAATAAAGFTLTERLTVHPEYVRGRRAVDRPAGRAARRARSRTRDGLARPGRRPDRAGPGRSPTRTGRRQRGRVDLHTAIDTEGRLTETRSDFDAAFGDWDAVARGRGPDRAPAARSGAARRRGRRGAAGGGARTRRI